MCIYDFLFYFRDESFGGLMCYYYKKKEKHVQPIVQGNSLFIVIGQERILTWHACKYRVHKLHQRYILERYGGYTSGGVYVPYIYYILVYPVFTTLSRGTEDVPLVEFMYPVFTRMPDENYRRRLRSLLFYFYYVFRARINSLVC